MQEPPDSPKPLRTRRPPLPAPPFGAASYVHGGYLTKPEERVRVHLRQQFVALVVALTAGVGSATAGDIVGRVQAPGANVDLSSFIVYVDVEGSFPPPTRPVVLDQRSLRFVPHV